MNEVIQLVFQYCGPVGVFAAIVIYFLIKKERKTTKNDRDKDSQELHDKLLKHDFEITSLKDDKVLMHTLQSDLQEQVNHLSTAVAKLSISVEQFSEAVKDLRNDIRDLRNK